VAAAAFGIAEGTVKSRLFRARRRLRSRIDAELADTPVLHAPSREALKCRGQLVPA